MAVRLAASPRRNDVDGSRSGRHAKSPGVRRGDSGTVGVDDDPVPGLAKPIFDPSTEKRGPEANPGSLVRRTKPVPSAWIAQMSRLPASISHSKAIVSPSGDQAGCPTNPMLWVSWMTFDPSTPTTYRSPDENASLRPSAENTGDCPSTGSLVIDQSREIQDGDPWLAISKERNP